ncbi:GxxExxY protein [Gemmatimonadota bacterium]
MPETEECCPIENAKVVGLLHSDLTEKIIGAFYAVYRELGYGFLESVYEAALFHILHDIGLNVERQAPIDVWFRRRRVGVFRADLVVGTSVIVELKAVRELGPSHEAQLLNALRATNIEVGLLLNFGMKPRFQRMVFANSRKQVSVHQRLSAAKQ